MRDMFFWQLLGDCFKVASYLLSYLFLAKGKVKFLMLTELIFGVSFAFLSYNFINMYGSTGPVIAFAINYFMYFIIFLALYNKQYFI